jgi:phosphate:Na+ symporter
MGQNIGTCVSAMISSIGATKNARRAAVIHLSFNVLATLIILPIYYLITYLVHIPVVEQAANPLGIAVVHTGFKFVALAILMPCSKLLEKIACKIVRDTEEKSEVALLDERLLVTPSVALERARDVAVIMADLAVTSFKDATNALWACNDKIADKIRADEDQVDKYEDKLGTYLVKISALDLSHEDSTELNELLHVIGDFERISDHAVNIIESAEEIRDKKLEFSEAARTEIGNMITAVHEILDLGLIAFRDRDLTFASRIEPLEEVIDDLRDFLKTQHIMRLRSGDCTIELGFVLSDLLTNLERVADHCSNVACCLIEITHESMGIHQYVHQITDGDHFDFNAGYEFYKNKYSIK